MDSKATKKMIVANWKLHQNKKSLKEFFEEILPKLPACNVDVVVAPVTTLIEPSWQQVKNSFVAICAQNVFFEESGAYTGECSVSHIKEAGATYAIVGHSERRNIFKETNEDVNKKVLACLHGGIKPIICVGENIQQRESGETTDILANQCIKALLHVCDSDAEKLTMAYEPVWAIGTGKSATLEQIASAHECIKEILGNIFSREIARKINILYGGSVNLDNISSIAKMNDVGGVLVGKASLQSNTFLSMISEMF